MKLPLFSYKFCMVFKFNTAKAVAYANQYILKDNPFYAKFENGEDCNFVSQCLFAGCENFSCNLCKDWHYRNEKEYSSSWVNAKKLFSFLLNQKTCGPFGRLVAEGSSEPGDVIFFMQKDEFVSAGILTKVEEDKKFFVVKGQSGEEKVLSESDLKNRKIIHIIGFKK